MSKKQYNAAIERGWATDLGLNEIINSGGEPMYGSVLGAAVTVPAAVVLPNTGGNTLLAVTAAITAGVGAVIVVSSIARSVAKKAHKA